MNYISNKLVSLWNLIKGLVVEETKPVKKKRTKKTK